MWISLAIAAGASLAVQAGINGQLRVDVQRPLWAALISFVVGTLALALLILVSREPLPGQWPTRAWVWTGGLCGALYIGATVVLVQRLGASTMLGLIVAGQMAAAVALDHFGWLGLPVHPLSLKRLAGVALVVVGVLIGR